MVRVALAAFLAAFGGFILLVVRCLGVGAAADCKALPECSYPQLEAGHVPEPVRVSFPDLPVEVLSYSVTEDMVGFKPVEVFPTSKGTFKLIPEWARPRDCPHGIGTIVFPDGMACASAPKVIMAGELDGRVFIVCQDQVLEYIGSDKPMIQRLRLAGRAIIRRRTTEGVWPGNTLAVDRHGRQEWGGLLQFKDGEWKFHPYFGAGRWDIVSVEARKNGELMLTMDGGVTRGIGTLTPRRIAFGGGLFTDLP